MSVGAPLVALTAAAALHAGFQVTVTALVYPALLGDDHDWARRHAAHGRRIVPLVVVTYGAVLLSVVWVLSSGPASLSVGVAAGGFGVILVLTAVGAAPRHGRLGRGYDAGVAAGLSRVDHWRCAMAVVVLAAAVTASVQG
ncbi:hypothetical protein [Terrabacter sp. RAF57]|uniref:hypothetical protein n=1 Tax=Terrabacter sp. RAF57 TaxID=3233063 RepID=UPI003F95A652